ncbi:Aminopeptidase [Arcticibacter svalbardensis MN12-7]|uniref:Aminopeptidase N n=1 Tax=Arcticibacter svalbardensis MN12-7 TaxID=1150600 RepID=R9GRE3_9SPHI|nr:M1 family metallopeptidase [Arcticibacter svalbardensis]EOR94417.1 Aminopeptidase [Arcticibacter svalbardensis MN12-7]
MKNIIFLLSLALLSCNQKKVTDENGDSTDPHSFSNPDQVIVKHLDLDLNVNFDTKILTGKATWAIENIKGADSIIFDTHNLHVLRVTLSNGGKTGFSLSPEKKYLGSALKVGIKDSTTQVTIWYTTSTDASALQWLSPQQTSGKVHPFLFTQSEAILARSWIPCQDSPGIRFTYNATITVPSNLLALMSAENPQQINAKGVYHFKQPHAIPSYLMALAVGDLKFKAIDSRTGIYAEPIAIDKAAWEFADMGKMVTSAEKLYGPYRWGRYDAIVLPPSFPFGGMENPMLTFLTPTVIAGDRSLVSLIAHELAHSWSGNLVTNATWNDFWLNEGFTVYLERRIVEDIYGKDEAKMQEVLGYESLKETLQDLGAKSPDTRLKGDYEGRDPDEGMTDIAYEKGYLFLKTIENTVGRARMDAFLKDYFKNHSFQSATTADFLSYLDSHLLKENAAWADQIKVKQWVYEPGIPANFPTIGSAKFQAIDSLVAGWKGQIHAEGLKEKLGSANEQLYFIKVLPANLSTKDMAGIDKEFGFTKSGNAELNCAWYVLAIRHHYQAAYPAIEDFLNHVGRRKFLIPLYKEMAASAAGMEWAKKIYKKARPNYHSVSYNTIDDLLK